MGSQISLEEQQVVSPRGCRHHWIIETPNGATSRGLCKRCGTSKRFPNAADDALGDASRAVLGRWARSRSAVEPTEIKLPKNARDEDAF